MGIIKSVSKYISEVIVVCERCQQGNEQGRQRVTVEDSLLDWVAGKGSFGQKNWELSSEG